MKLETFNQLNDADKNRILKTIIRQELDSVGHYINDYTLEDELYQALSSKASNFPEIAYACIKLRAKETYNVVYNFADDWHNLRSVDSLKYCSPNAEKLLEAYTDTI